MIKKIKSIDSIFFIFMFTFIICDFLRRYIVCTVLKVDSNLLGYLNYIFYIFLLILLIIKLKYKMYDLNILIIFLFIQIIFMINFNINKYSFERYLYQQVFVLAPLLLIGIKINYGDFKNIFKVIVKSLNILVIIIIALGVVDFITKSGVQKYLASHNYFESLLNNDLLNQTGIYRYYSFYGHPLRVAQIIVLFYILNSIDYQYFKSNVNMFFITLISIVGTILTSSKAGIIILVALILLNSNIYKKHIEKIVINVGIFSVMIFTLSTNIFKEVVLARLINIDFSSGRNDIFNYVQKGYLPKPTILGKGIDYTGYLLSTVQTNISSFEYPFLIFAYECGILVTVLMYICFLYPIFKIIIKKQYKIAIYFIALTGIINIYNGITVMGDYMIQYCFIVMIFINLIGNWEEINEEKNIIYNR